VGVDADLLVLACRSCTAIEEVASLAARMQSLAGHYLIRKTPYEWLKSSRSAPSIINHLMLCYERRGAYRES